MLDGVAEARAAACLIPMTEAAALHRNRLRDQVGILTPICATGCWRAQ